MRPPQAFLQGPWRRVSKESTVSSRGSFSSARKHAGATILRTTPLFDNQAFVESIAADLLKMPPRCTPRPASSFKSLIHQSGNLLSRFASLATRWRLPILSGSPAAMQRHDPDETSPPAYT